MSGYSVKLTLSRIVYKPARPKSEVWTVINLVVGTNIGEDMEMVGQQEDLEPWVTNKNL